MRTKGFSFISALGITAYLRFVKGNDLTVLSLHRISNETDYFFEPIRPEAFEKLIKYIVKHYSVISFADLAESKPIKKPLILSFDDGYYDFIEYALPLLTQYNIPSNHNLVNYCLNENGIIWTQQLNDCFNFYRNNSIYEDKILKQFGFTFANQGNSWTRYYLAVFRYLLNQSFQTKIEILQEMKRSNSIESEYRMMNWEDAKEIQKYGVEIGCHSYHHDSLNTIFEGKVLEQEIRKSKMELELRLNSKISIFAPPNGQYNESVTQYCSDIGFDYFLLVNDKTTILTDINPKGVLNLVGRIGMVSESPNEMIARTELFHSKIRGIL